MKVIQLLSQCNKISQGTNTVLGLFQLTLALGLIKKNIAITFWINHCSAWSLSQASSEPNFKHCLRVLVISSILYKGFHILYTYGMG